MEYVKRQQQKLLTTRANKPCQRPMTTRADKLANVLFRQYILTFERTAFGLQIQQEKVGSSAF